MANGVRISLFGLAIGGLAALAGCGKGFMQYGGERAPWRHQAEVNCMQSGKVKFTSGIVQADPIQGPGMCGADFPLKVSALGDTSSNAMSYGDDLRPPAGIRGDMPNFPPPQSRYAPSTGRQGTISLDPPPQPSAVRGETLRWSPGPAGVARQPDQGASAQGSGTAGNKPMSIYAPGVAPPEPEDDDIPDDAVLPNDSGPRTQPAYMPPRQQQRAPVQERQEDTRQDYREPPRLGPLRGPMSIAEGPAKLSPAATLACPLVSALDRWVATGVQPSAMRWFGSPVTEIKQISAYSCRGMVGNATAHISEHAFGNALDVAGFVLADGRKISVQQGWRGTPEEQGFLHDVQLSACDMFNTVLAPGYNAAHYNHIHVDLMRRASGRKPCRPEAMPGEEVAARARAVYASRGKGGRDVTGSINKPITIGGLLRSLPDARPGEDGFVEDEDDAPTGSIPEPAAKPAAKSGGSWFGGMFNWGGKGSSSSTASSRASPNDPTKNY